MLQVEPEGIDPILTIYQLQAVDHCRSVVLASLCKGSEPSPDLIQSTVMLPIEHFLADKYNYSCKEVHVQWFVVRNGKGGYNCNLDPCINSAHCTI